MFKQFIFSKALFYKVLFLAFGLTMAQGATAAEGVITTASPHSVSMTADKLESVIAQKGLTLFNKIDHQKNAAGVGLELNPTTLFIFGNPKVGTPLMQCTQSVAIDLPQKILITQDDSGHVFLSYNDPMYLKSRHDLTGCDPVLTKISSVLAGLTTAAIAP